MMTPRDASICEAVRAVRSGETHPRLLVDACIDRIQQLDDHLQAWVIVDADRARWQADDLHERIQRARRRADVERAIGPLAGIPVGIKDIFDVEGWPTSGGVASPSSPRHRERARMDSAVVARLRAADAILLGKTVTTELACFDPAETRNPWDPQATPGGSSSGSAAALAADMCWATIGSQTGGSISRPAAYCGVCGLKPHYRRLPMDGVIPVSRHLDHPGPLAKNVADLEQVWWALRGSTRPPNAPPIQGAPAIDAHSNARSTHVRLAVLDDPYWQMDVGQDVIELAQEKLGRANKSSGSPKSLPRLRLPFDWSALREHHLCIMAVEAAATHREEFTANPERFSANVAGLIERGLQTAAWRYADTLSAQTEFRAAFRKAIAPWDAVLTPATTGPPPSRATTGDPRMNCLWSLSGMATVTVPCGWFSAEHPLPLALQLGTARDECDLLRTAAHVEQTVAHEQRPLPRG